MGVGLRIASRVLGCALGFIWALACAHAQQRAHIVYIPADDLGWKDVGFHGGAISTPHLDRLAQGGVRLERFYTQAYSSPARAALLTGRYPMRYGLQSLSIQPWSQYGLPTAERLLPQALKEAGYRTAMLGTWQLGHHQKDYRPTQRGFDSFCGNFSGDLDCVRKTNAVQAPDWHRNEEPIREDGYCTTLIARNAARLIEKHDLARPLFLYLSFSAPQAPLQAPKEYLDRHANIPDEQPRRYAAKVSALDDAIGMVMAALEKKAMTRDTLIVFHSDNGGAVPRQFASGDGDVQRLASDNGPYRDGKGSLYEGSLRVVALASWPGTLAAGVIAERIHVTDMYPTLLGIAGARLEQPKPLDGIDQWATMTGSKASARKEMLLSMGDFHGALMKDDWKLIVYSRMPVRYELYDVREDPSEEDNRAQREPQRVQDMLVRFNDYAWEMAPSLYLEDLHQPRKYPAPVYRGDNPRRP